eukprot:919658-Rhodomonas_salina.2
MHSAANSVEVNRALIKPTSSSDPILEDIAVNPDTSIWQGREGNGAWGALHLNQRAVFPGVLGPAVPEGGGGVGQLGGADGRDESEDEKAGGCSEGIEALLLAPHRVQFPAVFLTRSLYHRPVKQGAISYSDLRVWLQGCRSVQSREQDAGIAVERLLSHPEEESHQQWYHGVS